MTRLAAPLVVLLASLLATLATTLYVRQNAIRDDRERFRQAVSDTTAAVQTRIAAYVAILRAAAGMFSADPHRVTDEQFRAFVGRLQLPTDYPGTLGIGFAAKVEPTEVKELTRWMRANVRPDYTPWPVTDGTMFPIKFIEPLDARNQRAMGYDMFSHPVRRAAMERARDTGKSAATGRVTLVQETQEGTQPGFLIYVPIYSAPGVPETVEERRATIVGFAYAPLRLGDLLNAIYANPDPDIAFKIFDGTETQSAQTFLYDSEPVVGPNEETGLTRTLTMAIAGRPWTFTFTPRQAFLDSSDLRLVPYVGVLGTVLSLSLFGITVALARALGAEQRAAEALTVSRDELRGVAERFRVALKNAPIIVYNTDLDLRYTWIVNAPGQLRPEQFLGKRDEEIVPTGELRELVELKTQVLRSGVGLRRELAIRYAGEQMFFDLTIEPLRDASGSLTGLTVAAVDVTNLRRAYEQYRLASLAVRSIIYDWDLRSGRVHRSEGLMDVLGFRADEVRETSEWWEQRTHPDDESARQKALRDAFCDGVRFSVEYRVRHRSGHWVDVLDTGIVVRDERGEPVRVVGNAMNISGRKEAERSLARHADELARSNADLQDFAYIASHDLKEPLRGIANYAKFLEEDQGPLLGPEGRERVETIRRLAQHMYGLLDSLLEFSRVGRTELAVVELDLAEVVDGVVAGLEPWLEQEGGTVRVVTDLPVVRADRVRVGQVFANLITNGIKYNTSPQKVVEIGHVEGEQPPVLFVRDNGIGIPQRHLPKLFHMFKRLHPRTHYGGGTGSGLALAKKILERHGGEIWLESEPGRGTTFFFRLQPSEPREEPAGNDAAAAPDHADTLGPAR